MPGGVQPSAEGEARHLLQQAEPLARLLQDLSALVRCPSPAKKEAVHLRRGRSSGGSDGGGHRQFSELGAEG